MNKVPKWGERFFSGPKFVCIIEESILDPKKKVLQTYTRNVGYSKVMVSSKSQRTWLRFCMWHFPTQVFQRNFLYLDSSLTELWNLRNQLTKNQHWFIWPLPEAISQSTDTYTVWYKTKFGSQILTTFIDLFHNNFSPIRTKPNLVARLLL